MVSRFPGAPAPPAEAYRVARGAPCALAGGRAGVDIPGPASPIGERVKALSSNDGTVTLLLRGVTPSELYRYIDGREFELLSSTKKAFIVAKSAKRTIVIYQEFIEGLTLAQFFLHYGLMHAKVTGYVVYRSLRR